MRTLLSAAALAVSTLLPGIAGAATLDLSPWDVTAGETLVTTTVDTAGDPDYFFAAGFDAETVILDLLDLSAPYAPGESLLWLENAAGDVVEADLLAIASDATRSELLFSVSFADGAFAGVSDLLLVGFDGSYAVGSDGEDYGLRLDILQTAPLAAVPLPGGLLLMGTAAAGLVALRRRG